MFFKKRIENGWIMNDENDEWNKSGYVGNFQLFRQILCIIYIYKNFWLIFIW